jgi:hypothetical protein
LFIFISSCMNLWSTPSPWVMTILCSMIWTTLLTLVLTYTAASEKKNKDPSPGSVRKKWSLPKDKDSYKTFIDHGSRPDQPCLFSNPR